MEVLFLALFQEQRNMKREHLLMFLMCFLSRPHFKCVNKHEKQCIYSLNVGNREWKFSKRTISYTNNVSKYYSFVTRFRFFGRNKYGKAEATVFVLCWPPNI